MYSYSVALDNPSKQFESLKAQAEKYGGWVDRTQIQKSVVILGGPFTGTYRFTWGQGGQRLRYEFDFATIFHNAKKLEIKRLQEQILPRIAPFVNFLFDHLDLVEVQDFGGFRLPVSPRASNEELAHIMKYGRADASQLRAVVRLQDPKRMERFEQFVREGRKGPIPPDILDIRADRRNKPVKSYVALELPGVSVATKVLESIVYSAQRAYIMVQTAGRSIEQVLAQLNEKPKRWFTFNSVLPGLNQVERQKFFYALTGPFKQIIRYKLQKNDSLLVLAQRYATTSEEILRLNKIKALPLPGTTIKINRTFPGWSLDQALQYLYPNIENTRSWMMDYHPADVRYVLNYLPSWLNVAESLSSEYRRVDEYKKADSLQNELLMSLLDGYVDCDFYVATDELHYGHKPLLYVVPATDKDEFENYLDSPEVFSVDVTTYSRGMSLRDLLKLRNQYVLDSRYNVLRIKIDNPKTVLEGLKEKWRTLTQQDVTYSGADHETAEFNWQTITVLKACVLTETTKKQADFDARGRNGTTKIINEWVEIKLPNLPKFNVQSEEFRKQALHYVLQLGQSFRTQKIKAQDFQLLLRNFTHNELILLSETIRTIYDLRNHLAQNDEGRAILRSLALKNWREVLQHHDRVMNINFNVHILQLEYEDAELENLHQRFAAYLTPVPGVRVLIMNSEYEAEGAEMHHCVYRQGFFFSPHSFILSIDAGSSHVWRGGVMYDPVTNQPCNHKPGETVSDRATVEITSTGDVNQFFSHHNSDPPDACRVIFNQFLQVNRQKLLDLRTKPFTIEEKEPKPADQDLTEDWEEDGVLRPE